MNNTGMWKAVAVAKGLAALVILAVLLAAKFNVSQFNAVYARWPEGGEPTFASRLATWDGAHYLKLSQKGYEESSLSCAFYPLWPAMVRTGAALIGDRPAIAAMVLANGFSVLGFWSFFSLIRRRYGEAVGRDSLILLLAFPGALFFTFPYTESMYFTLVMLFFWGLEKERWSWVALAGFLLPLGRPIGVFIILPLAWHLYAQWQKAFKSPLLIPQLRKAAPLRTACGPGAQITDELPEPATADNPLPKAPAGNLARWCLLLVFPLLGYGAYFGVIYAWTGNAFEGFQAQRFYPNSPSIKNIFDIAGFADALLKVSSLDGMTDSLIDRAFFILFLALLPSIYMLDRTWFWYVLPAGVVPALTSWFMSYRRYFIVLFPAFVVLALLLHRTKSRLVFWYYVVLLAVMQAWALKQFMTFNWAG